MARLRPGVQLAALPGRLEGLVGLLTQVPRSLETLMIGRGSPRMSSRPTPTAQTADADQWGASRRPDRSTEADAFEVDDTAAQRAGPDSGGG